MKKVERSPRSGRSDHKRLCGFHADDLPDEADAEDDPLSQTQKQSVEAPSDLFAAHTLWSPDQINEHVTKCLEMNTENKITPKNAFALQLIDCLKYLVDKKKDFSTIACSLDAGAKIYSYRVDALHEQVVGLANEVMLSGRRIIENADASYQDTSPSRMVRKKKKNTIATNDSISRKLKMRDPKDKYLKVNALPGALISEVRIDQAMSLSLENDLPFWPNYTNYKPTRADGVVELHKIEVVRDTPKIAPFDDKMNSVSPPEIEDMGFPSDSVSPLENEDTGFPPTVDYYADDFPEDPRSPSSQSDTCDGNKEDVNDMKENVGGHGNEVHVLATAMKRLTTESEEGMGPPPTRAEAIRILFDENSEYHYLNMNNAKYWAGPDFWKRPLGPPKRVEKKNGKRKKKQPGSIDFYCKDVEARWNPQMISRPLSNKTVAHWKFSKLVTPKDCKYDCDTFMHTFIMKLKDGKLQNQSANAQIKQSFEFVDVAVVSSIREAADENDPFCSSLPNSPELPEDFDAGDCSSSSYFQDRETTQDPNGRGRLIKINVNSESSIDDESLVPAPKMVTVNPIRYRARPIRVDMRHLKEKMLQLIERDLNGIDTGQKTTLSKLLRELPPHLDSTTRDELTPSIAFMALLTLANENELMIKSQDDYKDAIVSRWQDESYMSGDIDIAT